MQLEISALERELEDSLFNHDSLTGAITRFGILPTLREQQALVKRHAHFCYIALMDLDNFKTLNDLYGHAAGDQVLDCFASLATTVLSFHAVSSRSGHHALYRARLFTIA